MAYDKLKPLVKGVLDPNLTEDEIVLLLTALGTKDIISERDNNHITLFYTENVA